MLYISDLHRGFANFKFLFRYAQTIDPTKHLLVYSFTQFIMALAQHHHGTGRIGHQLIDASNPCIAGLRTSTSGSQYNMLMRAIIEYLLILRNDDLRDPHLLLPERHL